MPSQQRRRGGAKEGRDGADGGANNSKAGSRQGGDTSSTPAATTKTPATQPFTATRAQQAFGFAAVSLVLAIQFRGIVTTFPHMVAPWFGSLLARMGVMQTCIFVGLVCWSGTYAHFYTKQASLRAQDLIEPTMWLCIAFSAVLAASPQLLDLGFAVGNAVADWTGSPRHGAYTVHIFSTFPLVGLVGALAGIAQFLALRLGRTYKSKAGAFTAVSGATGLVIWLMVVPKRASATRAIVALDQITYMITAVTGAFLLLAFADLWFKNSERSASAAASPPTSGPDATTTPDQAPQTLPTPPQEPSRGLTITTKIPFLTLIFGLLWYNSNAHPHFQPGVVPHVHNPDANSTYTILARFESVTGYVSTIHLPSRSATIMRAGHSIIGGEAESPDPGFPSETVFPAFHLLELGRLVETPTRAPRGAERGLVIGLGPGTAAKGLASFGVKVDAVEVDPAVVDMARRFFSLDSANVSVKVRDGREFLGRAPKGVYDYVAHDVFTGGDAPGNLATVEALLSVRRVMKRDGVLTLNTVVVSPSPMFTSIAATIAHVFPYVRCFRDDVGGSTQGGLRNHIFLASAYPLRLRAASELDFGNSEARRLVLTQYNRWEVDLTPALATVTRPPRVAPSAKEAEYAEHVKSRFGVTVPEPDKTRRKGRVITDEDLLTEDERVELADEHWKVMRKMFGAEFWWNY
ncbi:hypothetical protein M427DRAFT_37788 [Gonapodya prolifera JEL478]|uniref:PABS domain-containing protein n=1 Tax=Gonapodya prolifera (strain JEL478) TaxID=1344416 RepID=A0A139A054_GONPJ|nr:hypothetical protein M427DRAFT_37788 [Gonapodya prolifera JEL478]|eukprot:KXS10139.1 hypothetical protein M427DRAFT_37788 [Gonapodya prolifera JEL478]